MMRPLRAVSAVRMIGVIKPVKKPGGLPIFAPETVLTHKRPTERPCGITVRNDITVNVGITLSLPRKPASAPPSMRYIWMAVSAPVSEYEWYLQKSMIRDIYGMYRRFSHHLRRTRMPVTGSVLGLRDDEKRAEYFSEALIRRLERFITRYTVHEREVRAYPRLSFKIPERAAEGADIGSETRIVHQPERIVIENNSTSEYSINEINNYLALENVAERVYKKIEDKLRLERLKKGYG